MDQQHHWLYKLSELKDFEVSPDNPDVRGWTLIGLEGDRIGEVHDLIVDTNARKVRYLDVAVDPDIALGKDHHVLVPVGAVRLHKNDSNVLVEGLDRHRISQYPMFDGVTITPEYERALQQAMDGSSAHASEMGTTLQQAENSPSDYAVSQARLDEMQAELENRRSSRYQPWQEQTSIRSKSQNLDSQSLSSTDPTLTDHRSRQELEDALRVAMAERDVAQKERDIARAERDIMRTERDQALANRKDGFDNRDPFNEEKFYENRRNRS